jgi:hypothetical protein
MRGDMVLKQGRSDGAGNRLLRVEDAVNLAS